MTVSRVTVKLVRFFNFVTDLRTDEIRDGLCVLSPIRCKALGRGGEVSQSGVDSIALLHLAAKPPLPATDIRIYESSLF